MSSIRVSTTSSWHASELLCPSLQVTEMEENYWRSFRLFVKSHWISIACIKRFYGLVDTRKSAPATSGGSYNLHCTCPTSMTLRAQSNDSTANSCSNTNNHIGRTPVP